VIKRISNAILAVLIIIIAVNLWLMHNKNAQQWYSYESEQLGRSLATQAARMLAGPLVNDDREAIDSYVQNIEVDSFIKGTALYDNKGRTIKSFDNDYSVVQQFRIEETKPLIFIQDIIHNDEVVGYLKLILDREAIIQHHQSFNKTQLMQTVLIICLTAVCAMLLTRLFYKIRNRYRFNSPENKLL
jgi:membrane protein